MMPESDPPLKQRIVSGRQKAHGRRKSVDTNCSLLPFNGCPRLCLRLTFWLAPVAAVACEFYAQCTHRRLFIRYSNASACLPDPHRLPASCWSVRSNVLSFREPCAAAYPLSLIEVCQKRARIQLQHRRIAVKYPLWRSRRGELRQSEGSS